MTGSSHFQPLWASAPGETISELLRKRSIGFEVFASDMGASEEEARCLLEGNCAIDRDVAERLHYVIGGTVSFWLKREAQYREDVARLHGMQSEQDARSWLRELPVNDMIKFGWIERASTKTSQANEMLQFFGVSDIAAWQESVRSVQGVVAFRTSETFKSSPGAVAAWLRKGELTAASRVDIPFNREKLVSILPQLRRLTRVKEPSKFIPAATELCEACGVALIIERAPQGCRASGATLSLANGAAMILMSVRYRSDDHFWFTFFHEVGHLVLHDKSAIFIEGAHFIKTDEERQADEFSERLLVPNEHKPEMLGLPADHRKIMRFAKKIGISPGIVIGQLHHAGKIPPDKLNKLKTRYTWE